MSACAWLAIPLFPLIGLAAGAGDGKSAAARLSVEPASVEVGLPATVRLEVEHAAGSVVRIEDARLEGDGSWVVLASALPSTSSGPTPGTRLTSASWSIVSLQAGERELPVPLVRAGAGTDDDPEVAVETARIEIRPALAAGEDAPRDPIGFLPPEAAAESPPAWPWILAAAGAAAALAAWVLRRMRRAPAAKPPAPAPLERLGALERMDLDSPEAAQEAHYALVRAVREHVDGALARDRSGLTDREWAGGIEGAVGAELQRELARLLAEAERAKYGDERPTHWATKERVRRAREALARVRAASASGEETK